MMRRRWVLAGVAVLIAVTATGGVVGMSAKKQATSAAPEPPANTAKVQRGTLSAMVSLSGTLTYRARSDGSPYAVINQARGTYTRLPDVGDKVNCGEVLYRVDDNPVLLLCGTVPAYRDLHTGEVGVDVRQLNRNLYTLGYDAKAGVVIDPEDNKFTASTEKALEVLQHDQGFNVGDKVTAGHVRAELNLTDLQSQLRQAQANLAAAQASYNKLVQGPQPADIELAQASIDAANRQVADARNAVSAARVLATEDAAANQHALDDAQKNRSGVQAQVDAATAGDKTVVQGAQRALADAQKQQAALPAVAAQQIQQAKDKLFSDQTTYDAEVARGQVTKEQRQAALDADQAGVDEANASAQQQAVQAQTAVNKAQTALNNANVALKNDLARFQVQLASAQAGVDSAREGLNTAAARDAQAVQNAQAQVNSGVSAQQTARANYDKAAARPTKADLDAAAAQVEAQKAALHLALSNVDVAGELHLDDAVFLPGPVRIVKVFGVPGESAAATGLSQTASGTQQPMAAPGAQVLSATSDTPEVQVNLDPSQQGEVKTGDPARITLPGNKSVTGKVDRLGTVAQVPAGQNNVGAATIPAYISLDDPDKARGLDEAPVQVEITTKGVDNALSVPVTALVGKSGGGFAVEVLRAGGRRELIAVKLGLFDTAGGRVQVAGDLHEGDQVVVPSL